MNPAAVGRKCVCRRSRSRNLAGFQPHRVPSRWHSLTAPSSDGAPIFRDHHRCNPRGLSASAATRNVRRKYRAAPESASPASAAAANTAAASAAEQIPQQQMPQQPMPQQPVRNRSFRWGAGAASKRAPFYCDDQLPRSADTMFPPAMSRQMEAQADPLFPHTAAKSRAQSHEQLIKDSTTK